MPLDLRNYTPQQKAIISDIENIFLLKASVTKKDYLIALNFLKIKYGGKK